MYVVHTVASPVAQDRAQFVPGAFICKILHIGMIENGEVRICVFIPSGRVVFGIFASPIDFETCVGAEKRSLRLRLVLSLSEMYTSHANSFQLSVSATLAIPTIKQSSTACPYASEQEP